MTPLAHDRLLEKGSTPKTGAAAAPASARGTTSRRRAGATEKSAATTAAKPRTRSAQRTAATPTPADAAKTAAGKTTAAKTAMKTATAKAATATAAVAKRVSATKAAPAKAAPAKAAPAKTAATKAAATTIAAAKAATAKAATAKAAATKAAATKAALARTTPAKAAVTRTAPAKADLPDATPAEPTSGTPTTAKAAEPAADAPSRPSRAKAAATRPAPAKTATAKATTAKATTAKATTAKATTAKATGAKPTPARRRPSPRPRPAAALDVVEQSSALPSADPTTTAVPAPRAAAEAADAEHADVPEPQALESGDQVAEVVEATPRRRRRLRVPPVLRRRSALWAAAALAGSLTLGAVVVDDMAAQADTQETVSESVSVAEELGITADSAAQLSGPVAGERLGEMVASRTEREDEQAAYALAQSRADKAEQQRQAVAAAEAARPKAVLPVQGARLTSGFGPRWGTLHAGIDLAAPMLTPEYAAMDGVVLEAGPASGYGLVVYVQHGNGDVTVYGHMEQILVQPGQVVRAGDTIALLGNRGQSTGPHLHFEVHVGGIEGQKIDPIPWLRSHGVQI